MLNTIDTPSLLKESRKTGIDLAIQQNWWEENLVNKETKSISFYIPQKTILPQLTYPYSNSPCESTSGNLLSETIIINPLKEFVVSSEQPNEINFADIIQAENQQKFLPKKLVGKLKSILKDLRRMEPDLYKAILKKNRKVDINEMLALLEFVGAEPLPKNIDIESLFAEMKFVSIDGD